MSVRRSICLYTPSTDPSGMGAHMVDLITEYAETADVALMMRPTSGGRRLLDRAAALMAFEQLGSATRALEITREFVMGRYAFGRPIASFQAVKHRLADLWCEIELARSNCFWAAWALENDESELQLAACSARLAATRALELAAVEMVQLHGGVGYTWEYDCHLFYRRSRLLGAALGGAPAWRDRLVARIDERAAA